MSEDTTNSVDDTRMVSFHPKTIRAVLDGAGVVLRSNEDFEERYEVLEQIGRGGTGEVHRVLDRKLNRILAMKAIRADFAQKDPEGLHRFIAEAQATAQLEHPSIVPIHDMGRLPDGRVYFTMKEVRGRTLKDAVKALHRAASDGRWHPTPEGWSFRGLLDAFRRSCEAVAHAHARGVIHRDLKPNNIMLGRFGEVLVLDWGLAKVVGEPQQGLLPVSTVREYGEDEILETMTGRVAGTIPWMSPEQANGEVELLGPPSDVWALGAVLFFLLTGRRRYRGKRDEVLRQARMGVPVVEFEAPVEIDKALRDLVDKATQPDPEARFADAGEMAVAVGSWLDGEQRRREARIILDEARRLVPRAEDLREQAADLIAEARVRGDALAAWDPVTAKRPAWELIRRSDGLQDEAVQTEAEAVNRLHAALERDPELRDAHELLGDVYLEQHRVAESLGDRRGAMILMARLRAHAQQRHLSYIEGLGAIDLVTDPPGAEVHLLEWVEEDRRLDTQFVRTLGRTPLRDCEVPMGNFLLLIQKPGHVTVRYPVRVGREEVWTGARPGSSEPFPIRLPRDGELSDGEAYVPAGWYVAGGEGPGENALPRQRVWVDGFVSRRHLVTNRNYLAFLDDLVRRGHEDLAMAHAPTTRGHGGDARVLYGRSKRGGFELVPDMDGDLWGMDWPVMYVGLRAAWAYADWVGKHTRHRWRLPVELEWEKAARGLDRRAYAWGNFFDPTWANVGNSRPGRPLPTDVGHYATDQSPYGVFGVTGGLREWCADPDPGGGPTVVDGIAQITPADPGDTELSLARGGSWLADAGEAHLARRWIAQGDYRTHTVGIRLVRSFA